MCFVMALYADLRLKLNTAMSSRQIAKRKAAAGSAWDSHLDASRAYILKNLGDANKGKVVILGSGHLFDVPLVDLSKAFKQVVLVDVEHPKSAKKAVKALGNVKLVTCDVTGINNQLSQQDRPAPCPPKDLLADADFTVSLNLISQIPLWPQDYLTKQGKHSDETINTYLKSLIQNHLDWLKSAPGIKCVIGDQEQQLCNKGKVFHTEDTLFGLELPPADETWTWKIAPKPIWDKSCDLQHKVCAFRIE